MKPMTRSVIRCPRNRTESPGAEYGIGAGSAGPLPETGGGQRGPLQRIGAIGLPCGAYGSVATAVIATKPAPIRRWNWRMPWTVLSSLFDRSLFRRPLAGAAQATGGGCHAGRVRLTDQSLHARRRRQIGLKERDAMGDEWHAYGEMRYLDTVRRNNGAQVKRAVQAWAAVCLETFISGITPSPANFKAPLYVPDLNERGTRQITFRHCWGLRRVNKVLHQQEDIEDDLEQRSIGPMIGGVGALTCCSRTTSPTNRPDTDRSHALAWESSCDALRHLARGFRYRAHRDAQRPGRHSHADAWEHRQVTSRHTGACLAVNRAAPPLLHGHGAAAHGCWSDAGAWPRGPRPNPGGQSPHKSLRARGSGGSM